MPAVGTVFAVLLCGGERAMETPQTSNLDRVIRSPLNYWSGFACHIATGGAVLAVGLAAADGSFLAIPLALVAGWATWTFMEYIVHRFVFHGRIAPALRGHALHHRRARATVGVPFFVPGTLGVLIWTALSVPLGYLVAGAWVAGLMWAYVAYGLLHHAQHHTRFRSGWLRALQLHHLVHHRKEAGNFGVTTRFWDRVFGTLASIPTT